MAFLRKLVEDTSEERLIALKVRGGFAPRAPLATPAAARVALTLARVHPSQPTLNLISARCIDRLSDESEIRLTNAMQTITTLYRGVFLKKFPNFGFDVINTLLGLETADSLMKAGPPAPCSVWSRSPSLTD